MNIDDLVIAIGITHRARVSLFIHGIQGLGKSISTMLYTSSNFHFYSDDGDGSIPYGYVDLRCASMESSELRGLPDKDLATQRMVYFPPDELPRGEWINNKGEVFGEPGSEKPEDTDDIQWTLHRGILVLEEVNRAEDDIHQALFQLVYDYRIGDWHVPTGWSIVATGNPSGGNFIVNQFMHEDAFKDRFAHVFVNIDEEYMKSWINFMAGLDVDPSIINHITHFCSAHPDHLSHDTEHEDIVVTPSPRSWTLLSKIEHTILKLRGTGVSNDDLQRIRFELLRGIVGQETANQYLEDIVEVTPQEVIAGFSSVKSKVKDLERNQIQALSWGVTAYANRIKKWSDSQMDNLVAFGRWILVEASRKHADNRDLAVGYFDSLLKREQESDNVRRLAFANESIQRIMQKSKKLRTPLWSRMHEDKELNKLMQSSHLGELAD